MEVNHERLPAVGPFGLMGLRGGNDAGSGPLFLDCLQPGNQPLAAQPAETRPPAPRTLDREQAQCVSEELDAQSQTEESHDEEPASDESAANPSAAPTIPTPPHPDNGDEFVLDKELVVLVEAAAETDNAGPADVHPSAIAAAEAKGAASPPIEEQTVVVPVAGAVELTAVAAAADIKEQPTEATKSVAGKSKPGKAHRQSAAAAAEEVADEPAEKSVAKPDAPAKAAPENTTSLPSTEVSPVDSARSEDASRTSPAKEAVAAAAEVKSLPTSAESAAPAADPSASTAQAASNPAAGAVAASPKPPAVLLKAKAGVTDAARAAGEIDPAKFLSRVAKAFESAHQRGSEVRLRLHPAELGALSIEVRIHDSVLTASVQAETPEAKAAIIDNLPALRERLAEQGIRIDKFDVDLMDHSDRRQQSLDEQTRQQEARQSAGPRSSTRRVASPEAMSISAPRNRTSGQGGLNVVI